MTPFQEQFQNRNIEDRTIGVVGHSEKLGEFWQIFFHVQFALLCCPFRIIKVTASVPTSRYSFQAAEWLPQKVLCVVFAITNLSWIQYYMRWRIPNNQENPSEYLNLLTETNITVLKLSVLYTYWFGRDHIIKIVNFLARKNISHFSFKITEKNYYAYISYKILFSCWCATFPFLIVIEWIRWGEAQKEAEIPWMVTLYNMGRKAFLLEFFTSEKPLNKNQTLSPMESIFSFVTTASQFNQEMFYANMKTVILLQLLTLWPIVSAFTKNLNQDNTAKSVHNSSNIQNKLRVFTKVENRKQLHWSTVRMEYSALKKLASLINSQFGLTFTCFIIHTIFYYSTQFSEYVFTALNDLSKIIRLIYLILNCCATFVTFILAGDICLRVSYYFKSIF